MKNNTISSAVIDNGAEACKAGFAGEEIPKSLSNVNDFSCLSFMDKNLNIKENHSGVEEIGKQGFFLSSPIKCGIITNWDTMERVWNYIFSKELIIQPNEYPVFMTESPLRDEESREKMAQIMFETFNVPAFYVETAPLLSLFSSGRVTGTVVDSGSELTYIVPIHQSNIVQVQKIGLAGRHLTNYLIGLIYGKTNILLDWKLADDIKKKIGYVAFDFEYELKLSTETDKNYVLPDGNAINLEFESFKVPELLFKPDLFGRKDIDSIDDAINIAIMSCHEDIRRDLYRDIVLSGGITLIPGLAERLRRELSNKVSADTTIGIVAPPDRQYSS